MISKILLFSVPILMHDNLLFEINNFALFSPKYLTQIDIPAVIGTKLNIIY